MKSGIEIGRSFYDKDRLINDITPRIFKREAYVLLSERPFW